MQRFLLPLGLIGYFTATISAASNGLQTKTLSLNSLENRILAGGTSNNTLHLNPDNFPTLNASTFLLEVRCFPSTASSLYPRVVVDDYYEAVDQILTRHDAMIPRQWILGPEPWQTVVWESGRCRIGLSASTLIRTPEFPIILAAHMAALVAKECVTEATSYVGGTAWLNLPERPVLVLGAIQSVTGGADAATA